MRDGLILTHGAGTNRNAPLLVALDAVFAELGLLVERVDLAFRQRPGPPRPADSDKDREGLRQAVTEMRQRVDGRVFLGGHSYGGRQSTMLAAESPGLADSLLLLSYPLHPPRKPEVLRTAHFSNLCTPALFVHGTRDEFGTLDEMKEALRRIPAPVELLVWEKAGHSLGKDRAMLAKIAEKLLAINSADRI